MNEHGLQAMKSKIVLHIAFMLLFFSIAKAQTTATLKGTITYEGIDAQLSTVVINNGDYQVYAEENGDYEISNLPTGKVLVTVFCHGFEKHDDSLVLHPGVNVYDFTLNPLSNSLHTIEVKDKTGVNFSMRRLKSIEGTSIYAGKKNEIIAIDHVKGNTANNNGREVYGKVPGLNIWESDEAGIQLGIGARGLSPKRTESFNVRQNGYDISADALGYPESYYTPATDALSAIQIVRGAASLQYGSQFGGLLNFVMKKPAPQKISFTTKNTYGSYNQLTSYNEVSGRLQRLSYFTYYQFKRGDGWRPNSKYEQHIGFANVNYHITENLKISLDYTGMYYKAQQPGGLTDQLFEEDPQQSIRSRNWFKVNWHLAALRWNWRFKHSTWSGRVFGLLADRTALGYLGRIDRIDPMEERNLILGNFMNGGVESRYLWRYEMGQNGAGGFLIGARYYQGKTKARQGYGSTGSDDHFQLLNESEFPLSSDFTFPSRNVALFSENVFFINQDWSIVPGIRFEYINTASEGHYLYQVKHPLTDEVLYSENIYQQDRKERSFVLLGVGSNYRVLGDSLEVYGNFSQNYRGINFNDIKINNPNFKVDTAIQDERGYNFDLGIRGQIGAIFSYDASFFFLKYNDRIGEILKTDTSTWTTYRYRTNISDARNFGVELFAELDWWKLFSKKEHKISLKTFVNFSYINARYINSENSAVAGNYVEMVPPVTIRTGIAFEWKGFHFKTQWSYVQEHYSDATNASATANAIFGVISSYMLLDLSTGYKFKKWFTINGGINNLTNEQYFTRRATGYPGPGIIPSPGITGYISLQFNIHSKH